MSETTQTNEPAVFEGELVPVQARAEMIHQDTDSWMAVTGGGMRDLAVDLAQTDFVPKGLRGKPAATLAAMLFGRELGLPPIASLQSLYNVDGRVGIYSQTMRALVLSAGHEFRIVSNDSSRCVIEGRRTENDEWQRFQFTFQEARDAGLTNKTNWKNYAPDMLLARATARMCKAIFADVIQGMPTAEEIQDMAPSVSVEQVDLATGEVVDQKPASKPRSVSRKKKAPEKPAGPEPERRRPSLPHHEPSTPVENHAPVEGEPVVLSDDDPASEGQIKSIAAHLNGRLGVSDRDDRLYWTAVAAEFDNPLGLESSKQLTRGQAKHAIDRLGKLRDQSGLDSLLPAGAQAPAAESEVQA